MRRPPVKKNFSVFFFTRGRRARLEHYMVTPLGSFCCGNLPSGTSREITLALLKNGPSGFAVSRDFVKLQVLVANPSQHPIGDQGDDIIWTDRGGQKQVRCSEEEIVVKKHNVIFERAKFAKWREKALTVLSQPCMGAEHCNFRDLKEELIRDQLVVGLCDAALLERLQMDPGLTLEKAVTSARQKEAVRKQQPLLKGDAKETKTP